MKKGNDSIMTAIVIQRANGYRWFFHSTMPDANFKPLICRALAKRIGWDNDAHFAKVLYETMVEEGAKPVVAYGVPNRVEGEPLSLFILHHATQSITEEWMGPMPITPKQPAVRQPRAVRPSVRRDTRIVERASEPQAPSDPHFEDVVGVLRSLGLDKPAAEKLAALSKGETAQERITSALALRKS